MKVPVLQVTAAALRGFAKFKDSDVRSGVMSVLEKLDADLTENGFEQAPPLTAFMDELQDAMDRADEAADNGEEKEEDEE